MVDNVGLVHQYIMYQIEERKLNISGVVRTITALINICKFMKMLSLGFSWCIKKILSGIELSQRQPSYNQAGKGDLRGSNDKTPLMIQHLLDTINF